MAIISSAAHLDLCGCGRHGRIITATGESSIIFCSKERACEVLTEAVKENKIAADEKLIVSSQIDGSSLAEEECDASIGTRIRTETFNALHEMWMEEVGNAPQPKYSIN